MRIGVVRALAFAAAIVATGRVAAQDDGFVTDFSAAPGSGRYSFASTTPSTLADLVDPSRPRPSQTIVGFLSLPPGEGPVPAVLLLHGSGGVYPELRDYWTRHLNALGMATFVIDMFGPRGVTSTVEDQSRVPLAADTADAFAALRLLATHPRIDRKRIAVMGFSRGGHTVLRTAVERLARGASLPDGLRFAAFIPTYAAGCTGLSSTAVKPGVFGAGPMLFIHGEDDDYTSAADCRDYAARIAAAGTPTEFLGLPGARHKFDASDPRRRYLQGAQKLKPGCPLEVDVDTLAPIDRRTGESIPWDRARAMQRETCAARGASIEGDGKARDAAMAAVAGFLQRVFAR